MKNEVELLKKKAKSLEKKYAQMEKRLQQSEERFHKIFHASSNLMAITTVKDGILIDLNEASAGLGGYNREELIGASSKDLSLWADNKQRDRIMKKLQSEGRVRNVEVEFLGKSGELHQVLFSADPITMNDEPCLLSVSIDITALEKESDALRESEEKFRMLVENSLQGLAIVQDRRFVFCNSTLAAITGYSIEEMLSFPDSEEIIHPDDRELVRTRYDLRIKKKPVPRHYEFRIIRKDGIERWLEVYSSLIEYKGKPSTQTVLMDITERRQAENALKESKEYLNQIINHISDPIFVKDREHNFVLVNDAMCAFVGLQREELLGNKSALKNVPVILWEQEEDVFNTGGEYIAEDHLPDWQGNYHVLMSKKSLLTDKSGNKQIVGVLRDITEHKRLEAQFLQAQKMEAIGLLAGGVAHDFNNLLNVINGYSELMLEDLAPGDPIRKDIQQIKDAGQRAASLTSQLLAFGRKQILQPEILSLDKVISQMSSMLRRLIGEDVEFNYVTKPDLGLINADPGKIEQIIMNLAVNARDAMPQGGRLTIETANVEFDEDYVKGHPVAKRGSYVMLAISDSGLGMDADTQAHLYEPFFTTKEKGKGTGLGLSTVYGIVKQSEGFIWVYSEPEKGTTFKIYFPRAEGEADEDLTQPRLKSGVHGFETILVVEDESSVRSLVSRILRERGYKVLEAANGEEALRTAQEFAGAIHLILTDAIMPGISGKELVARIETTRPGIKSLFVSGYTDNAIVHHGILDSNIAFLQKPFSSEGLSRKVRTVLDS